MNVHHSVKNQTQSFGFVGEKKRGEQGISVAEAISKSIIYLLAKGLILVCLIKCISFKSRYIYLQSEGNRIQCITLFW